MTVRFGAHQSAAGGYDRAATRVADIGGNALQLFSTSPRGWKPGSPSDEEVTRFQDVCSDRDVMPAYFHAAYLINLAGKRDIQKKSCNALIHELSIASRCGVRGSVVHLGSFVNDAKNEQGDELTRAKYEDLLSNIDTILSQTPNTTSLLIENMGMRKVGRTLEEIGFIIRQLDSDRLRVCLDTCHLHAAGYDISSYDALSAFLNSFDNLIGLERLDVWHVNDSKDEFGSLRDRHENIGEGFVGAGVFEALVNHEEAQKRPFILETPGFDGGGPDQQNLDRLKEFVRP